MNGFRVKYCGTSVLIIGLAIFPVLAQAAISPTWTGSTSTAWVNNANWTTPATVPGLNPSPFDTAIFSGTATRLTAANTGTLSLNSIVFNPGATTYTITNSSAGNFTLVGSGIINNSSNMQAITNSAILTFQNSADAGSNITITNNNGGTLNFQGNSTATNATIVNNGTGIIDISGITNTITMGSLAGAGNISLGSKELAVGALNTNTTISGILSGSGGHLTKIGTGTLTLTSTNTYTGNTTISEGALQIGSGSTTGSIAGDVVNNAALIFNRSNAITYNGTISGTGVVSKLGAGTLMLTGNNTYSGITTISTGTLQIGNGGTSGSITGDIINNAALAFNRSDALTYAGQISGTGTLSKLGTGTLTLTNNNTYTGITTISGGSLQVGDGGTNGSIAGNITNNAALAFNRSDTTIYTGVVRGTGSMTKLGDGNLTLTGANTYSGGTTISSGILQIGNGGTTGSIVGNITDDAALQFNRSNGQTYAGVISGSGSLSQLGTSTLTLTADNTYNGGTTITSGTLQLGSGGTTGSVQGNILDNAALIINRSNALTLSGMISGTGTLTKQGAGALTLTADNTYTGTTTISTGSLSLGNGGTSGTVAGNIIDNAALTFNRSDDLTFAGLISGTGTVTKVGTNILTLTANNTYTGITTISAGTLQIGNGGMSGSIAGNITDNAALAFNRSDSSIYAGVVSGTGSVTKLGSGTLILTGTNTFSGGTTISDGTLQVGNGGTTGSITGNITDNANLAFNRSNAQTFAGLISGVGSLTKLGTGTLTLSADNTYNGGTMIANGTLQLGSGGTAGSVQGNILDNAALVVYRSNALTLSGVISGTGTLTKQGAGALTLTADNTYTGTTTISTGSLSLGNGGTSGNVAGNIVDNAALTFNRSDDLTFVGLISGTGTVTKLGTDTLTLTANNTYTGITTLSAGTLQIGNGGISGSIAGNITDNAALAFNRSDTLIYAGVVSGTGSVTKLGTGTLTLTGTNTFSGGTTISEGTLQIGNGGTTGSIAGNITDNAVLAFNRSNAQTFAGVISGTGSLTKLGTGTLTLSADNTYIGNTTITSGTLQLGSGGTAGSVQGNILDNAALIVNRSNALTLSGVISGTGTLTKQGAGALTLTADNTYTGTTTISSGSLSLGNGGTSGKVAGNIVDNAALTFNRSDDLTFAGLISGTGTVTKLGTDTLTLTANNTYTGSTTISAGSLQIGNGGMSGSIAGNITDNAALAFNRSDSSIYAGVVSGTGSVTKLGTGTLILTGANTFSGGTTISEGTLQVGNGGTTGSIAGNITDNAVLAFNRSNAQTFAGVISGTGSLTKLGTGTLTLTANNTYTGITTISAGTLSLGNGGTSGIIAGDIIDNAALTFNRSNAVTYDGTISGIGTVTKLGANTLTLTGNNTYSGTTTISVGTLQIGNGGTTGSIAGNIIDNATFVFNRSDASIYAGIISGTGRMTKLGTGTLILTGDNTYSNGTTISAGTLQIGNAGTTGNIVGNVTDNAALAFNRSDSLTFAGLISGTGSLSQLGNGTLTLTANNTYTGGSTISSGRLQIGNGGITGEVQGDIVDNAALIFNRSDALTYSGAVSGTGTLEQHGTGTLTLTADNTYTGITSISAGKLQIGNGGTSGSITGNIIDNSMLQFNRADTTLYSGTISGSGSLIQSGSGTLILTGNNNYSGGTIITEGTLQLGDGGTAGMITNTIVNNSKLVFNHSNDVIYDGIICGTGTIQQMGSGTLTINGANTCGGSSTINTGRLLLGDSSHPSATIAGNISVETDGSLQGYGIAGADVFNGGTISPGNSIGTFTINGNYQALNTGNYSVEVDANGNNDLLIVGGTAQLAGTVTLDAVNDGFLRFHNYTILTANGGVFGQFANVNEDGIFQQGYLTGHVYYLPNAVEFTVDFNPLAFASAVQTPNQKAVANYILETGGTTTIQSLIASLTNDQPFQSLMDQMSGATYANQTLNLAHIDNWFESQMSQRFNQFPTVNQPCSCNSYFQLSKPRIWLSSYGDYDHLKEEQVSGLNTNSLGSALGVDIPINKQIMLGTGVAVSHFHDNATVREMSNSHGDLYQIGCYGHYTLGQWLFGAAADVGATDSIDCQRQVQSATGIATTTGKYHAHLISEQAQISYDFQNRDLSIRPFCGFINQQVHRGHFAENSHTGFELDLRGGNYHSSRSQLGIMLQPTGMLARSFAQVSWEHEFADTLGQFNAQLVGLDSSFHIIGTELGRDQMLVKAGITLIKERCFDIAVVYDARFADAWKENGVSLEISFL